MSAVRRVAIVGFGSLGSMYAGCFGRAMGADGVFVVADDLRTGAYRSTPTIFNGEPISATFLTYDEARMQASESPFDVVLLAVKYGALDEAMGQVAPLVGPDTAVISVLNGITSEEVLAERFGWDRVLLCVAQEMDARKVGNEVTAGSVGALALGVHDASDPVQRENLSRVVAWLDVIGQSYVLPDDIKRHLWGKLICNVGVNQACAVYDCCFEGVQRDGEPRRAMIAAMQEVAVVARAVGVNLTDDDVAYWLDVIDHLNPKGMPSLRQDVLAGRPTEVELFGGTISRLGAAHGIPTPQNERFHTAIKDIEARYA